MTFTVENLEFYLLLLVRISAFIFVAPFFGYTNVPMKVKAGISIFVAIILFQTVDYQTVTYNGVVGFAGLVMKEAIVGLIIGYSANICSSILSFAGQLMDMEIGFAMVNVLDPVTKTQITITANLYTYFIMLLLIVTNMHHYILRAFIATYSVIPISGAVFKPNLYIVMARFMADFFIIGFRIVLPIFSSILIVNVVLAILAKVAPQMNMFVIGMQLKILVGLFILFMVITLLPAVSDFIFDEMKEMMNLFTKSMSNS